MNLIFLHGALGCKKHWLPIIELLDIEANIHNLDFPSHGCNSDRLQEYTIQSLATFVENYILNNKLDNCVIIGYSLGGYVALFLAQKNPFYFKKLILLATKVNWTHEKINTECNNLTFQNLEPILPKLKLEQNKDFAFFIKISQEIIYSIHEFQINEQWLSHIEVNTVILLGDKDKMIPINEMEFLLKNMSNSKMNILENQQHLLHKMDAKYLSLKLKSIILQKI